MAYDPMSPAAAEIARGVLRLLASIGAEGLTEVTLANKRRADVLALSAKGEVIITEIKSSVADYRCDQKWPEYLPYCDQFYFAVGQSFPKEIIPPAAGLIVADGFGGAILREPAPALLAPARRKALTLRFARLAARRHRAAAEIQLDAAARLA